MFPVTQGICLPSQLLAAINIQVIRYQSSASAPGTFDGVLTVTAQPTENVKFQPLSTLAYFANEQVLTKSKVDDKLSTYQGDFTPSDAEYLTLYDETL